MDDEDKMPTSEMTINVSGMTCDHCARAVREELCRLEGVERVDVDLASGFVTLHAASPVKADDVRAAVEEAGYEVSS
jgi:copper ion binding protein